MPEQQPWNATYTPEQRAAYVKLDEAIEALSDAFRPQDQQGQTDVAVDAVLLVGLQNFDDDGDRVGAVAMYPRHGSQPTYITHGLLARVVAMLNRGEDL